MSGFLEKLKNKNNFVSLGGVREEEILAAERTLGLVFAKDYREYLLSFGLASFEGHELTGIIRAVRLNVIDQTVLERKQNPHIPNNFYVIEVANIDGIFIWQNSSGEVFQTVFDSVPVQICKSLVEYLDL